MKMTELFSTQLQRESAGTRRTLERVPEGHNDWKPHEKSMPLGYLAALVASMPGWVTLILERDELNLDDPANGGLRATPVATKAELLQMLDEGVTKSCKALAGTTEEHLLKPWR